MIKLKYLPLLALGLLSSCLPCHAQVGGMPLGGSSASLVYTNRLLTTIASSGVTNRIYYTNASAPFAAFGNTNLIHIRTNAATGRWEWHTDWATQVATNDANRPTGTWRTVTVEATVYGYTRYEPRSVGTIESAAPTSPTTFAVAVDSNGVVIWPTNFADANNFGGGSSGGISSAQTNYTERIENTNTSALTIAAGGVEFKLESGAAKVNAPYYFQGLATGLTGIPAANLTGTLPNAVFPAELPAASAAGLTNVNFTPRQAVISGTNFDGGFGDRVLFVGDSVMIDSNPWWPLLTTNVLGFFGTNGWFGGSSTPGHPVQAHLTDAATGAAVTRNVGGANSIWYGAFYTLPPTGGQNFYHNSQTYIRANVISIPYLTGPGAGEISVYKRNSGATTLIGTINTDAAFGSGYTNFNFATEDCYIVISNASAANVNYIAPGIWDTNASAFRFGALGKGGMDDWTTNYAARAGALAAFNPTKVIYHQVGGGTNLNDASTTDGWAAFIRSNMVTWPNADVYVCVPWGDSSDVAASPVKGGTPAERAILRGMAATNGWRLIDLRAAFGSYQTLTNRGLLSDNLVHATHRFARLAAGFVVDEIGWFRGLDAGFSGVGPSRTNIPWATKSYVQERLAAQSVTAAQLASWEWLPSQQWMLGQNATYSVGGTAGTSYVNAQPFWTDWIRMDDNVANSMIQRSVPFGLGWRTNILTAYVAWTNSVSCRITNTITAMEFGASRTLTATEVANEYVSGLNTITVTNVWTVDNVPRVIQWGISDNTNGASVYFLGAKLEWR